MHWLNLYLEGILIGLRSLWAHPLRTSLTMTGIAFGIFAITGIFTFVNSMEYSITKNLDQLGNTILFVHKYPWKPMKKSWKLRNRPKISYSDYIAMKSELAGVEGVAFEVDMSQEILKAKGRTLSGVTVKAVTEEYSGIFGMEIGEGRYFAPVESEAGRPVCVIGINIAENLFPDGSYTGKYIHVNGKKLLVVGVVKKEGSGFFGDSSDDLVFIPYKYAVRTFSLDSKKYDSLVTVRASSHEDIDLVEQEISGIIRIHRGLKPGKEDNFSINKQEMLMNQVEDIFKYLHIGGLIISVFSIIVGGFGIGNIMYASVKERTFEIGLQKSLGATRRFILFQFLFEAILLCLAGGALGMLVLVGCGIAAEKFLQSMDVGLEIVITAGSIIGGFAISIFIGLASGFLPSMFASALDPVDAMRA